MKKTDLKYGVGERVYIARPPEDVEDDSLVGQVGTIRHVNPGNSLNQHFFVTVDDQKLGVRADGPPILEPGDGDVGWWYAADDLEPVVTEDDVAAAIASITGQTTTRDFLCTQHGETVSWSRRGTPNRCPAGIAADDACWWIERAP